MNQPSTPETNGASAPAEPAATLQQRVNALHEQFNSEQIAGSGSAAEVIPPAANEIAPASAVDSGIADAATERRARLAALSQREREQAQRRRQQAQAGTLAQELEAARRETAAARALAEGRLDRALLKDPAKVISLLGAEGVPPEKVAEAIREAITNPELAAERAAKNAVTPEVAALRERLAELEARDHAREQAWHQHRVQNEEQAAASEFFRYTIDNAQQAPHAAALLNKRGADEFYAFASEVAKQLPPGSGWQAVLDGLEETLSGYAPIFSNAAPPTNGKAALHRPAAAPARTLSNSLAQERASVAEGDEWSSLSFEERVARLKSAR